jgi:Sulfotransferase domain
MTWPNVFIVGVGKAGTSSLSSYMAQHPDVYVSPVKEPHFFSDVAPRLTPAIKDERAYLRLFARAHDKKVRLEASISYFWDEASAAAIKRAVPEAKAIVVLRAPVARAYSHYWHAVRYGDEARPFMAAIEDELAGRPYVHNGRPADPYVRCSRYVDDLRRFRAVFGDDLLVLLLEDLVARPREGLATVFEFVGVDPEPAEHVDLSALNEFALPRSRLAARMLNSSHARRLARAVVPRALRSRVERAFLAPDASRPPMDDDARALLERELGRERPELERFLGRPLPW